MATPGISIVVPIYNSEKGLDACIGSILAQSHKDFELILVNDGSTDNSESICRKFAERDPRVVVLNQNNRGVSAARNRGMAEARGAHVMFVDSDDRIEDAMLDIMMRAVQESQADLAICGIRWLSRKGKGLEITDYPLPDKQYDANSLLESMNVEFENQCLFGAYGKIFSLTTIRNHALRFDERMTFMEDVVFVMNYLVYCRRIATVREVLYHYYRGNFASLATRVRPDAIRLRVDAFAAIRETFQVQGYSRKARLNLEYVYIHSLLMGLRDEWLHLRGKGSKWTAGLKAVRRIVHDPSIRETVSAIRRRRMLDWVLLGMIQYRLSHLLFAGIALAVAVNFRGAGRNIAGAASA